MEHHGLGWSHFSQQPMSVHSNKPSLCQPNASNTTILAPNLCLPRTTMDQEAAPRQEPSTVASITDGILQDFRTNRKSYVETSRTLIAFLETLVQGKILVEGPQPQLLWQVYQLRHRFDIWQGALPCRTSDSGFQQGLGTSPEDFLSSAYQIYSGLIRVYIDDIQVQYTPESATREDGSHQGWKRRRPRSSGCDRRDPTNE